jgi:hypothetical protein
LAMASMAWCHESITTSTATSAFELEFAPPTGSSPRRQTKEAKEFFGGIHIHARFPPRRQGTEGTVWRCAAYLTEFWKDG